MDPLIAASSTSDDATNQWLIFRVAKQAYGISILRVQELRGYEPDSVSRIVNTPPHVLGVVNLRGQIIPVIDFHHQLTGQDAQIGDQTILMILNFDARMIGVVVDGVSDVVDLPDEAIKPIPAHSDAIGGQYVMGMAQHDQMLLQLLDLEPLVQEKPESPASQDES